jgi:cytoskeletal protein CcmA (bactofilin family)
VRRQKAEVGKKEEKMANRIAQTPMVTFGETTSFTGTLRFKEAVTIRGKFKGTIESGGDLVVDKGAVVEADHVNVRSVTVKGRLTADVRAEDKADFWTGSEITGDVTAERIRIADGVQFEGRCNMARKSEGIEIFSRPIEEIKSELQGR